MKPLCPTTRHNAFIKLPCSSAFSFHFKAPRKGAIDIIPMLPPTQVEGTPCHWVWLHSGGRRVQNTQEQPTGHLETGSITGPFRGIFGGREK
eukprot:gene14531-21728_t